MTWDPEQILKTLHPLIFTLTSLPRLRLFPALVSVSLRFNLANGWNEAGAGDGRQEGRKAETQTHARQAPHMQGKRSKRPGGAGQQRRSTAATADDAIRDATSLISLPSSWFLPSFTLLVQQQLTTRLHCFPLNIPVASSRLSSLFFFCYSCLCVYSLAPASRHLKEKERERLNI